VTSSALLLEASSEFGPFTNVVDLTSAAVAAAASLIATLWGKRSWHPQEGILEKVSVLAVAVGMLLLSRVSTSGRIAIAVAGVLVGVAAGIRYAGLVEKYRFRVETSPDQDRRTRTWYVVSSDTLTRDAQAQFRNGIDLSDIVKNAGYDPDRVWDRGSRAHNTFQLQRWYMSVVVGGTIGLAAAAMAVGT
jgi:hypothetical protein